MSRQRASFVAVGFIGGIAAGTLVWSRMQRQYRRNLFSKSWEPRAILRSRGARLLRQLESTL